jgi:hypothetical protein
MTIEEAVEKFNQLPIELQLEFGSDEFLHSLQTLEAAYNIFLSAIAVQIVVGAIQFSDLSQVLEHEFSLPSTQATHLAKDIREKAFDPIIERLNFLDNDPDKTMTLDQQKNFAEKLFSSRLISEIHHDPFIIDAINQRIFYILAREEDYHTRLERTLYENQELVTSNNIKVNEESVKGTVSNWLKDYISKYGSQTFDSMSQSAFLINSDNARNISPSERELLAKVIKSYINIKFFPESMPSDNGEGWEIIPVDDSTETQAPSRNITKNESTVTSEKVSSSQFENNSSAFSLPTNEIKVVEKQTIIPKEIKPLGTVISRPAPVKKPITPLPKTPRPLTQAKPQTKPQSIPKPLVNTQASLQPSSPTPVGNSSESSDELLNLKNMLLQYPPHSLEREAIEEEIKKIEKS